MRQECLAERAGRVRQPGKLLLAAGQHFLSEVSPAARSRRWRAAAGGSRTGAAGFNYSSCLRH